jgi:hypothetical protein
MPTRSKIKPVSNIAPAPEEPQPSADTIAEAKPKAAKKPKAEANGLDKAFESLVPDIEESEIQDASAELDQINDPAEEKLTDAEEAKITEAISETQNVETLDDIDEAFDVEEAAENAEIPEMPAYVPDDKKPKPFTCASLTLNKVERGKKKDQYKVEISTDIGETKMLIAGDSTFGEIFDDLETHLTRKLTNINKPDRDGSQLPLPLGN